MKRIIAIVGMAGAGKTEAAKYLYNKGVPFARFGEITDAGVKALGLPLSAENERKFRETLRRDLGMAAYAIKMKPRINTLLKKHNVIVLDGLYSWEEYVLLKKEFSGLILIHIFAEPNKRYERLSKRPVRPLSFGEGPERDIAEIENLNKGGPIAMADYLIENNSDDINSLYRSLDLLLTRLGLNKE